MIDLRAGADSHKPVAKSHTWQDFYGRLQEHYRCQDQAFETQKLAERYQDVLTTVLATNPSARVLDLGCGQGFFLDYARSLGFQTTRGFEIIGYSGDKAESRGHLIEVGSDFRTMLSESAPESVDVISLVHVIEHMPPETTYELLVEVHRVLAPEGRLLIETPSVTCLFATARQFYLDPTHITPVHPDYLDFMLRDIGFEDPRQSYFAVPEGPSFPKFENLAIDPQLQAELLKIQNWTHGPMDFVMIACR